jgi:glucan phosphoethanolaminetransferase (alkaline phosphatase superfamily)
LPLLPLPCFRLLPLRWWLLLLLIIIFIIDSIIDYYAIDYWLFIDAAIVTLHWHWLAITLHCHW